MAVQREVFAREIAHRGVKREHGSRAHYTWRHADHEGEEPYQGYCRNESDNGITQTPKKQCEHGVDDAEMQTRECQHVRHAGF